MKVGLIGLGRMGTAMARRVLAAGHDLLVYNRTPQKAADLVQAGARAAATVSEACADREVLITMVADDSALEEVALGSGGVRDSLPRGAIHVAMGTHGVAAVRAITAAHVEARQSFIAAPVLRPARCGGCGETRDRGSRTCQRAYHVRTRFWRHRRAPFQCRPQARERHSNKACQQFRARMLHRSAGRSIFPRAQV